MRQNVPHNGRLFCKVQRYKGRCSVIGFCIKSGFFGKISV
nr:MAG TPA: hypothetical protein [Caudoviricetes sp.]